MRLQNEDGAIDPGSQTISLQFRAPLYADRTEQVQLARDAAVQLLALIDDRYRGFRAHIAENPESDSRFWHFVPHTSGGRSAGDVIVLAFESPMDSKPAEHIKRLQEIVMMVIRTLAARHSNFLPAFRKLLKGDKPLAQLLKWILEYRNFANRYRWEPSRQPNLYRRNRRLTLEVVADSLTSDRVVRPKVRSMVGSGKHWEQYRHIPMEAAMERVRAAIAPAS